MDQDVKQVFLLQDEEVGEAIGFDISRPPVPSIFGRLQQTKQNKFPNSTCGFESPRCENWNFQSETLLLHIACLIQMKSYLISPNTQPAFSVTNTMLLSGPPTTCTAPPLMMYISLPMSPCMGMGGG